MKLMSGNFVSALGLPRKGIQKAKATFALALIIDHVLWSQDLCSLIGAINKNSFRDSNVTFVEDTFREIQGDIFNTFGEPGKTVAWTASSILGQANGRAYVLQEYIQHLTDQFYELVNFTGTKCVDKEKMFSLLLQ